MASGAKSELIEVPTSSVGHYRGQDDALMRGVAGRGAEAERPGGVIRFAIRAVGAITWRRQWAILEREGQAVRGPRVSLLMSLIASGVCARRSSAIRGKAPGS